MSDQKNRSKILISIIVILLLSNIAILGFFLLRKDNGHGERKPDRKAMIADFLKKEIGFSDVQLRRYDTLSDKHRDNIKKMFDSLRSTKDRQFKQLTAGDFSDSVMNRVADQSAATQKLMELQMFGHLKNVRALCTPDQLPKFDSLFVKMLNRRGGEGRKKTDR